MASALARFGGWIVKHIAMLSIGNSFSFMPEVHFAGLFDGEFRSAANLRLSKSCSFGVQLKRRNLRTSLRRESLVRGYG
jgi:hypothetical protein